MSPFLRIRRAFARIWIRLLAFNLLLVFLPIAGTLYLDVYEQKLLEAQERSMVQQGRVLAAALGARGRLPPAAVERVLRRLEQQVTARIRVVDADGLLLADSSQLGPRREPGAAAAEVADARDSWVYRIGSALFRLLRIGRDPASGVGQPAEVYAPDEPLLGPEVLAALAGRYGAATRISPGQRSVTLYSALPIRRGGDVLGAVLVSQSTFRLLEDLVAVRAAIFRVFLLSVAAATLLSLLAAFTIVRPLGRLRREATSVLDRQGRLRGRFGGPRRQDDIGDPARALEELSRRLEQHLAFIESFAADVSHEFKNPLASIRAATELVGEVEGADERRRFVDLIQRDVARMEHLLSAVREITLIDAELEHEARTEVDLVALLEPLLEGVRLRSGEGTPLAFEPAAPRVTVHAQPERLARVFENLLDNAIGFSPPGEPVEVAVGREGDEAVVTVRDRGPGVPEPERERIFERFFSQRKEARGEGARHTGLGLAIVRAIVEGYGGRVGVSEPPGGGALFEVRLPA